MPDVKELTRQQTEKQQWHACDPVTLVAIAREKLYEVTQDMEDLAPIEEVLARFEQQSRATIGGAQFSTYGARNGS